MHKRLFFVSLLAMATVAFGFGCGDDSDKKKSNDDDGGGGMSSSSSSSGQGGSVDCYAGGVCNPTVINDCGINGEACDLTDTTGFQCFDPPNDAMLGQACDNGAGPFCSHGTGCNEGFCATFCCENVDCPSNNCVPVMGAATFGAFCAP